MLCTDNTPSSVRTWKTDRQQRTGVYDAWAQQVLNNLDTGVACEVQLWQFGIESGVAQNATGKDRHSRDARLVSTGFRLTHRKLSAAHRLALVYPFMNDLTLHSHTELLSDMTLSSSLAACWLDIFFGPRRMVPENNHSCFPPKGTCDHGCLELKAVHRGASLLAAIVPHLTRPQSRSTSALQTFSQSSLENIELIKQPNVSRSVNLSWGVPHPWQEWGGPRCWGPTYRGEWDRLLRRAGKGIWASLRGRSSAAHRPWAGLPGTRRVFQCSRSLSCSAFPTPEAETQALPKCFRQTNLTKSVTNNRAAPYFCVTRSNTKIQYTQQMVSGFTLGVKRWNVPAPPPSPTRGIWDPWWSATCKTTSLSSLDAECNTFRFVAPTLPRCSCRTGMLLALNVLLRDKENFHKISMPQK